jgi:hypothetical protein
VVQFSDEFLDLFGAPELSELTRCGAKDLPNIPDYLSSAIWNRIHGISYSKAWMLHLDLLFLRRTSAAFEEYGTALRYLRRYVEGTEAQRHELGTYLKALTHFEHSLNSLWQACEVYEQMEKAVSNVPGSKRIIFKPRDNSDLENINKLNNTAKHFSAKQAEDTTTPVWITNSGLKSSDAFVSFDKLHENLMALSDFARELFINIPAEAISKAQT